MFSHRHYLPILKTKSGELWAVANLRQESKTGMIPIFEIHKHKTKGTASHVSAVAAQLFDVWGNSPLFLDTKWLSSTGNSTAIHDTFAAARATGLSAIPVVSHHCDLLALSDIRDVIAQDGRGCMLRLSSAGIATGTLNNVLHYLQINPAVVDLLIDYQRNAMDLQVTVPAIPYLNDWRTFAAASGSFPSSLASFPLNAWHQIPRFDWQSWESDVINGALQRRPAFSDYVIRDPGKPAEFGSPSACIRYTRTAHWMVRSGRKLKDGFATDIHQICADLVNSGHFDGPAFSEGDRIINEVATQGLGSGGAKEWVQWAMNHHLAFVLNQLQSHAGL